MRIRPLLLALTVPLTGLLAACGGGEVTVRVMSGPEGGELAAVENTEVTFVPYDRDSIFDAMSQRAEEPEPQIPQELRNQFDQVIEAQQAWREAESQWNNARDELQQIRSRMDGLDERSREYLQLFERFDQVEQRVNSLDARRQNLFERFDSLQKTTVNRADSLRAIITSWEENAFRGYVDVTDSILRAKGIEEVVTDTTGAQGYVSVRLPEGGDWWVFTRHYPGPFEELYWNVQLDPAQADTLVLDRGNAESRPRL